MQIRWMRAMASSLARADRRWLGWQGLAGAGILGILLAGCATGPDPILSTGGQVPPNIERSLRCPRDTQIVFGRIAGVQTAAWCQRTGPAMSGVKHGPFVEWYDNLQKKNVGLYEEGQRQGPWRFYLPSGQLESEVTYDHDRVVSQTQAPVPASTAPAQTTPAQTAPAQTTPAQTAPAQTTPAQMAPAQTTPAQTAPAATTAPGTK